MWSLAQLRDRVAQAVRKSGKVDDQNALNHLLSLLRYVQGDYNSLETFKLLKQALAGVERPVSLSCHPAFSF